MTSEQIRLQFGEMTAAEMRTAKAILDFYERQMAAMESKHQTALSCLFDEKRKKEAAIAERDEWEKRYDEQTKLASEVIAQRDLANERVEAKQSAYERCADQLTAMTSERDALKAEATRWYEAHKEDCNRLAQERDALRAAVITKWCSCGAPLTACGEPDSDGEPAWDCNLCMVRSQRDEALRALAAVQLDRDALTAALIALLNHYVALVNSGDAGNWNPELETPVIRARAALGKGRKP